MQENYFSNSMAAESRSTTETLQEQRPRFGPQVLFPSSETVENLAKASVPSHLKHDMSGELVEVIDSRIGNVYMSEILMDYADCLKDMILQQRDHNTDHKEEVDHIKNVAGSNDENASHLFKFDSTRQLGRLLGWSLAQIGLTIIFLGAYMFTSKQSHLI